ncbi:MAG: SDR family oxidoreductase, partial [Pseudonocardiaceae bacterium]|nr:SDR family oxidoreductase [Pseudonocardiaceae bacterium]
NNAGMAPLYPSLAEVEEALFDKVIDVNLKGPFRLTALAGERMVARNGGSVINISSASAVRPTPHELPYAAAKAALNVLTAGFAQAYGPTVRVNAIMAGPFFTDISRAWDMDRFNERAETFPLRRGGQPNEIVGTALYFATDASSYTTGTVLPVDGGRSVAP